MLRDDLIAATDGPFVTPNDWRVAARAAHSQNRRAVKARRAGDEGRARDHQGKADWYIAKARLWRGEWRND
jgi:hypothetical protein